MHVGRVFQRHGMDLFHDADHFIQGGLALGLRGLYHQVFRHDQREVHGGRMDALIQHGLGDVSGGDAVFLVHLIQGDDEFVHAMALGVDVVSVLQLVLQVIGVEHRVVAGLGDALFAQGEHIGQRPDHREEVAVEGLHAADGIGVALHGQVEGISIADRMGLGQIGGQDGLAAHSAAARAAAAMGGGEGLVQVQVDYVKAHVARPDFAHDGVEVGAVVIGQAACLPDDLGDLQNVLIEYTQGVGVRQHQAGSVFAHCFPQLV